MTSTYRPIEDVLEDVGSIASILERHGYDSGRHMTCPSPDHDDRKPGSVSILPASTQGPERIYCHSCGLNENPIALARLLGEHVQFTKPSSSKSGIKLRKPGQWRKPRTYKQRVIATWLQRELSADATQVEKDWIAAQKLAALGNQADVQKEIARDYDYFSSTFHLARVYRLVQAIWSYGTENHGLPADGNWKRWVEKVVKDFA